jgi:alpha-1,2-mannosyltransferase
MKLALAALALVLVVAVAASVPLQPYQDFQVLFHANMGLLRGITLYDQPGQVRMIAQFAQVPAGQVYVLPFPYPPWYALSTIWVALLPVDMAARVWFGLNMLMLVGSIGILTRGQPAVRRALMFLGGIFWIPTLGSLLVGQYGFPVLLGAALMVYALWAEKPILVALAAILLTFKPHLGLAILLVVAARLLSRRDRFSRAATRGLLIAGAMLLALGFLASPRWPMEYAGALIGFQGVHGVPECTQCVSLPALLARLLGDGLLAAKWIGLALAALSCGLLAWRWKTVEATASGIVSIGVLATLLVSPYVLNYDYLLLLPPLITLAGGAPATREWIALGIAYALPTAALALWGPAGNLALIASTFIVLILTLRRLGAVRSREPVPAT